MTVHVRYSFEDGSVTKVTTSAASDATTVTITNARLAPKRSLTPEPSTAPHPLAPSESGADSADAPGAAPDSPDANASESDLGAISAPPVPEPLSGPMQAPLTRKRRTLMGAIRAMWTFIFGFIGEAAVYVLDQLDVLNLPPGTGVALGAVLYGVKRYAKPEGLL